MGELHILWTIQLSLEAAVLARGWRARWRTMCPSFLVYLAADLTASSAMFAVSLLFPQEYDLPARTLAVLLTLGKVALVVEAYRLLAIHSSRHIPVGFIVSSSLIAAGIVHALVSHEFRWPWSSLETIWGFMGMINVALCFIMAGVLFSGEWRASVEHWHARILCAYLFFAGPCYYAASQHVDSIGKALMIAGGICYGAWLWCMVTVR